jgi:hypothetical protein
MSETLRPESRTEVENKTSIVEIAGQILRGEKKSRKRPAKKKARKRLE